MTPPISSPPRDGFPSPTSSQDLEVGEGSLILGAGRKHVLIYTMDTLSDSDIYERGDPCGHSWVLRATAYGASVFVVGLLWYLVATDQFKRG